MLPFLKIVILSYLESHGLYIMSQKLMTKLTGKLIYSSEIRLK